MLAPTPPDKLVDQHGRPYFLWDVEMTLDEFRQAIQDRGSVTRHYFVGKVMRQGKPDDALHFVSPQ